MLESDLLQKINVSIETESSVPVDNPVTESLPLSVIEPPLDSPPVRACEIVKKLLSKTLTKLNKIWYGLDPDEAYVNQIQSLAMATTQPPFTKEKIESFVQALADWRQYESTRVATWIEWARSEVNKWEVQKCSRCAQRVAQLIDSGVSREKAIQISFCENLPTQG